MKPAVIFPDGHRIEADTWVGLERLLREDDWNPSDKAKFRAEMFRRAKVWSGTIIDNELVSEQFFEELERAGLVLIERW